MRPRTAALTTRAQPRTVAGVDGVARHDHPARIADPATARVDRRQAAHPRRADGRLEDDVPAPVDLGRRLRGRTGRLWARPRPRGLPPRERPVALADARG